MRQVKLKTNSETKGVRTDSKSIVDRNTVVGVKGSSIDIRSIYDGLGRPVASIDGRGNTSRTEYDSFGRRIASVDADNNRTTYAYDRFGYLASVTDPLGNAIVYEYDLRGHKIYEGGATYPVRYAYDLFGNKVSMTTYRDERRIRVRYAKTSLAEGG